MPQIKIGNMATSLGKRSGLLEAPGEDWSAPEGDSSGTSKKRESFYDVLPGRTFANSWILRSPKNGKIVNRTFPEEGKGSFVGRCRIHCQRLAKTRGPVTLRVRDAAGHEVESFYFPDGRKEQGVG